ncbi:hypothetical protein GCK72_019279 [Caenorhabditis remanei]|uniref:PDZ domain-containing protein n=1 Tax=Caenorhabditis remanei TaxID=31234 RepID=A0A6A5GDB6_CAERE|nr:hypothetical protein GCK72_019279 [Caenorhabditis remanei]KAF1752724.1 hypothetical protein GCK72_019279 [Caenorhabditis remanei]
MSAELLNLSREKKRAFRAGKFPEDIITKDMIREVTCTIDCCPGTPNYKEFKVTEGMLFTRVPLSMSPPIEYCDHLLKINGKSVTKKREMQEELYKLAKTNKPHYLTLTVRRIISVERLNPRDVPSNASIKKPDSKDMNQKPNSGYVYFKVVLIYFPRSKLGINVKSYANVVYVESTDNSWGSTTRRFLYLGDSILKIDDTEIYDVQATQNAIRSGFQKNGIITMIIERAKGQTACNFTHGVLKFAKPLDPRMPQDALLKCREQLAHYEKNGFSEPDPIFKGHTKDYSTASRAVVTETVEMKQILQEHYDPEILKSVSTMYDFDLK